jgi:hypothetical protein
MTSKDLIFWDVKKNMAGEYYTQKGGQKRNYISDEILEDIEGHPTVKEFLDNPHDFNITLTINATVRMPNQEMAELYAAQNLLPSWLWLNGDNVELTFGTPDKVSNVSVEKNVEELPEAVIEEDAEEERE